MARPRLTKRRRRTQSEPTADFAGLKRRAVAFGYDYIVIAIYIGLLAGVTLLIPPVEQFVAQRLFVNAVASNMTAFFLLVLPVILYFTLQEGSARASTWGKRRVGLRVVSAKGEPTGYGQALIRSVLKFLPWQLAHSAIFQSAHSDAETAIGVYLLYILAYSLVAVYLLYLWRHPAHRTPYDLLAGTVVIVPH